MKDIISIIRKNSIFINIFLSYLILLYLLFLFSSKKNLFYSLLIFFVIILLALAIYNYNLSKIYNYNLLTVMSSIANGKYEKISLDENKHTELDSQLNMISARVETLEKQKDSFIYDISHELRTPLSTMKILSQSISDSHNNDVEIYKEFFNDIVSELDRMNNIISDMMASVDLDPNNYIIKLRLSYLNYLCESIIKRLQPIAFKKNIIIEFIPASNLQIYLDATKIERALLNIIENAIKYSECDSKITVRLFEEKNRACISVQDEGIGISQDEVDRIFERFYRIKKDRSRATGGSGLGLYIAKKIIDMHQGEIYIVSEENAGSIFTIKLPMNLYSQNIFNKII